MRQPYCRIDRIDVVKQGEVFKPGPAPRRSPVILHQVFRLLDNVTLDDLEDRIYVRERFLVDLLLSSLDDLLTRLFPGWEEILDQEGFIGELFEVLIGEIGGLGLPLFYLLGQRLFLTLLKLGLV